MRERKTKLYVLPLKYSNNSSTEFGCWLSVRSACFADWLCVTASQAAISGQHAQSALCSNIWTCWNNTFGQVSGTMAYYQIYMSFFNVTISLLISWLDTCAFFHYILNSNVWYCYDIIYIVSRHILSCPPFPSQLSDFVPLRNGFYRFRAQTDKHHPVDPDS